MKILQVVLLILAGCLPCQAGDTPNGNVPPIAEHELERRGNAVREIGTGIQATEADAVIEALAPPASDADKWYVTLITQPNCPPCERLKYDIENAPALKAWVNVKTPKDSQVHYQARSTSDPTQAGWLASLKERLDRGGFPAIVIQPPRSKEYGDPSTVVAIIHGYEGNPKALVGQLSGRVAAYVKTLHRKGMISRRAKAPESAAGIGSPPPFVVDDRKNDPFTPSGPHDWPPPQMLTIDQIKAIVPEASADFVLLQLRVQEATKEPLSADDIKRAWQDELDTVEEVPAKPEPEIDLNFQPAQPTKASWGLVMLSVLGVTVVSLIGGLLFLMYSPDPSPPIEVPIVTSPAKKTAKKKPTKSA